MKKQAQLIGLLTFLVLLNSCVVSKIIEKQNVGRDMIVEIDSLHMVIRYKEPMSELQKKEFRKKFNFKAVPADSCGCGNPNIELLEWNYDDPNISNGEIQTARNQLKGGGGGAQGDDNFTMVVYPLADNSSPYRFPPIGKLKQPPGQIIQDRISDFATLNNTSDQYINIAVIDTGVNTNKLDHFGDFLYPSAGIIKGCDDEVSGWNFVDDNYNTWDEHGHGTNVIRIIGKNLNSLPNPIPFRILPIKAFNSEGKASYWNMICALNYVKEINDSGKGNIHILNTSFGYGFKGLNMEQPEMTQYRDSSLFRKLMEDIKETTIVSASAGNIKDDIDKLPLSNYPASFPSDNLIGVGGYNLNNGNMESAGNFGLVNLDLAAQYKTVIWRWLFFKKTVQGSSFSTAHNSAKLAEIIKSLRGNPPFLDPSPAVVRSVLLSTGQGAWIDYNQQQLGNFVDQGRYIKKVDW